MGFPFPIPSRTPWFMKLKVYSPSGFRSIWGKPGGGPCKPGNEPPATAELDDVLSHQHEHAIFFGSAVKDLTGSLATVDGGRRGFRCSARRWHPRDNGSQ
jgi:hypothetical protein